MDIPIFNWFRKETPVLRLVITNADKTGDCNQLTNRKLQSRGQSSSREHRDSEVLNVERGYNQRSEDRHPLQNLENRLDLLEYKLRAIKRNARKIVREAEICNKDEERKKHGKEKKRKNEGDDSCEQNVYQSEEFSDVCVTINDNEGRLPCEECSMLSSRGNQSDAEVKKSSEEFTQHNEVTVEKENNFHESYCEENTSEQVQTDVRHQANEPVEDNEGDWTRETNEDDVKSHTSVHRSDLMMQEKLQTVADTELSDTTVNSSWIKSNHPDTVSQVVINTSKPPKGRRLKAILSLKSFSRNKKFRFKNEDKKSSEIDEDKEDVKKKDKKKKSNKSLKESESCISNKSIKSKIKFQKRTKSSKDDKIIDLSDADVDDKKNIKKPEKSSKKTKNNISGSSIRSTLTKSKSSIALYTSQSLNDENGRTKISSISEQEDEDKIFNRMSQSKITDISRIDADNFNKPEDSRSCQQIPTADICKLHKSKQFPKPTPSVHEFSRNVGSSLTMQQLSRQNLLEEIYKHNKKLSNSLTTYKMEDNKFKSPGKQLEQSLIYKTSEKNSCNSHVKHKTQQQQNSENEIDSKLVNHSFNDITSCKEVSFQDQTKNQFSNKVPQNDISFSNNKIHNSKKLGKEMSSLNKVEHRFNFKKDSFQNQLFQDSLNNQTYNQEPNHTSYKSKLQNQELIKDEYQFGNSDQILSHIKKVSNIQNYMPTGQPRLKDISVQNQKLDKETSFLNQPTSFNSLLLENISSQNTVGINTDSQDTNTNSRCNQQHLEPQVKKIYLSQLEAEINFSSKILSEAYRKLSEIKKHDDEGLIKPTLMNSFLYSERSNEEPLLRKASRTFNYVDDYKYDPSDKCYSKSGERIVRKGITKCRGQTYLSKLKKSYIDNTLDKTRFLSQGTQDLSKQTKNEPETNSLGNDSSLEDINENRSMEMDFMMESDPSKYNSSSSNRINSSVESYNTVCEIDSNNQEVNSSTGVSLNGLSYRDRVQKIMLEVNKKKSMFRSKVSSSRGTKLENSKKRISNEEKGTCR